MSEYLRNRKKERAAARSIEAGFRRPATEPDVEISGGWEYGDVLVSSDSQKRFLWDNVTQTESGPFENYQIQAYLLRTVFVCTAEGCGWHTFHSDDQDNISSSKDGGGGTGGAHIRSVLEQADLHQDATMEAEIGSGVPVWRCTGCGMPFGAKSRRSHIKNAVEAGATHDGATFRHIRQYSQVSPAAPQPRRAPPIIKPAVAGEKVNTSWLSW